MPKKKTKEEFIENAKQVHGEKYDYSLVEYINNKTKVKIICKEHGTFEQLPSDHTNAKAGCQKCSALAARKRNKKTIKRFSDDVKATHGEKYDYSLVEYVNNHTKVKIICKDHGIFEQTPADHINKQAGCARCYGNIKSTTTQFIEEAIAVHGEKYDYSLVDYVNNHTKVKIICKEHGIFEQAPKPHVVMGHGCSECGIIKAANNNRKSTEQFIKEAKKVHGNKFDYYLVEYINSRTKVKIICKDHGIFEQNPQNHIHDKYGCMECWNENRPPWRGWMNDEYFNNNPNEVSKNAILYVIEMTGKI